MSMLTFSGPQRWQFAAAVVVLVAAFVSAWPEIHGMTHSSLWQDELFSIERYSSKGPAFVMTHYHEANNHIFFNVINSLTPGTERFAPFFARFWSFTFVGLTVTLILLAWTFAGQPFLGALQVFLLLANLRNINLLLQARGYGLLAFIALSCTLLTWRYFQKPSLLPLVALPFLVWLGAWTVPTFAFFGGSLLLVLAAYSRDYRWLPGGAAALIAIIAVYWPVHGSLLEIARTYTAIWGKEFGDWSAISDTLSLYLLFGRGPWLTFLVFTGMVFTLARCPLFTPTNKAAFSLGLAVFATFLLCLMMETAAKRTVAFLVVPLGFIGVALLGQFLSHESRSHRKVLIFSALIAAGAVAMTLYFRATYQFVPIEAWRETAQKIVQRFPAGTEVVATFRPIWLKTYLPSSYPVVSQFDKDRFLARKQIVVDSSFMLPQENAQQAKRSRFPTTMLPHGYARETVPQIRGGSQKIYFWPR